MGDKCEIIVNDFRKGYDHAVTYAINSELSNRQVGDSPRGGMIAKFGENIDGFGDSMIFFYPGIKRQGEMFKSCTTLIADEEDKIIGSICVNMEISNFIFAQGALNDFIQYPPLDHNTTIYGNESTEICTKNVDEILSYYMQQCEKLICKPMPLMTKEEKVKALDYLEQRGVFKITKASNILSEAFGISRYTLYSYLEEAKKLRESNVKD